MARNFNIKKIYCTIERIDGCNYSVNSRNDYSTSERTHSGIHGGII